MSNFISSNLWNSKLLLAKGVLVPQEDPTLRGSLIFVFVVEKNPAFLASSKLKPSLEKKTDHFFFFLARKNVSPQMMETINPTENQNNFSSPLP